MMSFIRYALATICFAASVGCLALWWPSFTSRTMGWFPYPSLPLHAIYLEAFRGSLIVVSQELTPNRNGKFPPYADLATERIPADFGFIDGRVKPVGRFGRVNASGIGIYMPLWYASLVFALAGVGILRFRRQFSIRSALICVSVVALLQGIAVIL